MHPDAAHNMNFESSQSKAVFSLPNLAASETSRFGDPQAYQTPGLSYRFQPLVAAPMCWAYSHQFYSWYNGESYPCLHSTLLVSWMSWPFRCFCCEGGRKFEAANLLTALLGLDHRDYCWCYQRAGGCADSCTVSSPHRPALPISLTVNVHTHWLLAMNSYCCHSCLKHWRGNSNLPWSIDGLASWKNYYQTPLAK